jgi:hypothetical protein
MATFCQAHDLNIFVVAVVENKSIRINIEICLIVLLVVELIDAVRITMWANEVEDRADAVVCSAFRIPRQIRVPCLITQSLHGRNSVVNVISFHPCHISGRSIAFRRRGSRHAIEISRSSIVLVG